MDRTIRSRIRVDGLERTCRSRRCWEHPRSSFTRASGPNNAREGHSRVARWENRVLHNAHRNADREGCLRLRDGRDARHPFRVLSGSAITGPRRRREPMAKPESVWWLFGALGGIVGSRHCIIVKQHPLPRRLEVIHLTTPRRPDKGDDACNREQQGDGEGDVDNGHKIIMNYEL